MSCAGPGSLLCVWHRDAWGCGAHRPSIGHRERQRPCCRLPGSLCGEVGTGSLRSRQQTRTGWVSPICLGLLFGTWLCWRLRALSRSLPLSSCLAGNGKVASPQWAVLGRSSPGLQGQRQVSGVIRTRRRGQADSQLFQLSRLSLPAQRGCSAGTPGQVHRARYTARRPCPARPGPSGQFP